MLRQIPCQSKVVSVNVTRSRIPAIPCVSLPTFAFFHFLRPSLLFTSISEIINSFFPGCVAARHFYDRGLQAPRYLLNIRLAYDGISIFPPMHLRKVCKLHIAWSWEHTCHRLAELAKFYTEKKNILVWEVSSFFVHLQMKLYNVKRR